jgi:hypothetical protein
MKCDQCPDQMAIAWFRGTIPFAVLCTECVKKFKRHHFITVAIYEDTLGNYGSSVLDGDMCLRLSVCDECLVKHRDRLRLVRQDICAGCHSRVLTTTLTPVPDDFRS